MKDDSVKKFILAGYANIFPMNTIGWPPIMSNEPDSDDLGLYKQIKDETDVC